MKGVEMENLELEDANALRKYNDRIVGLTADLKDALHPVSIGQMRLYAIASLVNDLIAVATEMRELCDTGLGYFEYAE